MSLHLDLSSSSSPSSAFPLQADFSCRLSVVQPSFSSPPSPRLSLTSTSSRHYLATPASMPQEPQYHPSSVDRPSFDPYHRLPPPPLPQSRYPHQNLLPPSPQTPEQGRYRQVPPSPAYGVFRELPLYNQTPPSGAAAAPKVKRRISTTPKIQKVFVCTGYGVCAMTFTRSEHLARHQRKHTGEKPFVCHCSKAFSRIDNLRQHCASTHAELEERNNELLARLLLVHVSLAQQYSRDQKISRKGRVIYHVSPPRDPSNTLAPIGEHLEATSPEVQLRSLPSPDIRLLANGGRPKIPQLARARGGSRGAGAGVAQRHEKGQRWSWNGEDEDHPPPDGLGLFKREGRMPSSSISAGIWLEENELESEERDSDEDDNGGWHRRGLDSNVAFGGEPWAPPPVFPHSSFATQPSNGDNHRIPPPLTFTSTNSNFTQHRIETPQFSALSSSGSSLFPVSSAPFPSSANGFSHHAYPPSSALAPAFGHRSPFLDVGGGSDSRPGSRGASLDLSHPLPWGSTSTLSSHQLHPHPSFNIHSSHTPSQLHQTAVPLSREHQSTYGPNERDHYELAPRDHLQQQQQYNWKRSQALSMNVELGNEQNDVERRYDGHVSSSSDEHLVAASRPPSPPSLLWGLPQLSPRKRELRKRSQQHSTHVDSSPESSRSSGGWGADESSVYSGGRQEGTPRTIQQRRVSLSYHQSNQQHSSYTFGTAPAPHYQTLPPVSQHPGLPTHKLDSYLPRPQGCQQNQVQIQLYQPSPSPGRVYNSTPVVSASPPTKHEIVPDAFLSSYASHLHEHHHQQQQDQRYDGRDTESRPLPQSPALHEATELSPLTCPPDLPLPPHHREPLLELSPVYEGSVLLQPSHHHHQRSPSSPRSLQVHLSLESRSREYSDENSQRYYQLAPKQQLISLPPDEEGSNRSDATSLDSVNFTRRRSLALSVSDLMGPSVQHPRSRPSTSAGAGGMEGIGEEGTFGSIDGEDEAYGRE